MQLGNIEYVENVHSHKFTIRCMLFLSLNNTPFAWYLYCHFLLSPCTNKKTSKVAMAYIQYNIKHTEDGHRGQPKEGHPSYHTLVYGAHG